MIFEAESADVLVEECCLRRIEREPVDVLPHEWPGRQEPVAKLDVWDRAHETLVDLWMIAIGKLLKAPFPERSRQMFDDRVRKLVPLGVDRGHVAAKQPGLLARSSNFPGDDRSELGDQHLRTIHAVVLGPGAS